MKNLSVLLLLVSINTFSQKKNSIDLSEIKLCELSIADLRLQDPNLEEVKVEEMDLCTDGFVKNGQFENRKGYKTKNYPGVIFQKYQTDNDLISKIHLTTDFNGYLPDGNYVDLKTLKASDVLQKYDSLNSWTSRGCSDYYAIKTNKEINFYVKIDKTKQPQYPVDQKYYSEQLVDGIDIVANCYQFLEKNKVNPLYIIDGVEVTDETIRDLKPDDVETIVVLKNKSAIDKYGEKGKNGVIEIYLKKKDKKSKKKK